MRFTKRALSALLALVMVFTMLPLQVWAEEVGSQDSDNSVNLVGMYGGARAAEPVAARVELNESSALISIGNAHTFSPTVYDEEGNPMEVTGYMWISDKPEIASVENGVVTGVSAGVAKITCQYGELTAMAMVTVTQATYQLTYSIVYPSDAKKFAYNSGVASNKDSAVIITPSNTTITESYAPESVVTIPEGLATTINYRLTGFADTQGNKHPIGSNVTISSNMTLTSEWEKIVDESSEDKMSTITLRYHSTNQYGGSIDKSVSVMASEPKTDGNKQTRTITFMTANIQDTLGQIDKGVKHRDLRGWHINGKEFGFNSQATVTIERSKSRGRWESWPSRLDVYPVEGGYSQGQSVAQFYVRKQTVTGTGETEKTNYYSVGTGTVKNLPYGTTSITGEAVQNYIVSAPSLTQIASLMNESLPAGATVNWYKMVDTDNGYHVDGEIRISGRYWNVKFIDPDSGKAVQQQLVQDGDILESVMDGSGLDTQLREFKHWSLQKDGEPVDLTEYTVRKDITFYAVFERYSGYTVKHLFEDLDGNYVEDKERTETIRARVGAQTGATTKPKEGFTALEFEQKEVAADGRTTIEIKYSRNSYDVSYTITGNAPTGVTAPGRKTYKFGATVEQEPKLQKEGYSFDGWEETVLDGKSPVAITEGKFTMPDRPVVFSGTLTKQEFTVSYVAGEGGTVSRPNETVPYGDNALGSTATPNEGYYFVGWKKNGGAVSIFTPEIKPTNVTANATYTAVFAEKTEITVKANDLSKVYDGTEITAENATNTATRLPEGYTLTVTYKTENAPTNVKDASGTLEIASVTVKNEEGQNVTAQFKITKETGTLSITPKPVTITVDNNEKQYGEPDPTFTGKVEGLVEENDLGVVTFTRTNTDEEVKLYQEVLDAKYKENDNYSVTVKKGNFEIKQNTTAKVVVTIVGNQKTVTYNGSEQAVTDYDVGTITIDDEATTLYTRNDFSLKSDVEAKASGTNAGTYYMGLTKDSFQNNNPNFANVKFEVTDGWLRINPATMTLTAVGYDEKYDGGHHSGTVTAPEGATLTYSTDGGTNGSDTAPTVKDVADGKITVKVKATLANYKDAEATYTLNVQPRNVTLTSGDDIKPYGQTAQNDTVTVTGDGFVAGEGVTYKDFASLTLVGSKDNTFDYTLNEGTEERNYIITKVEGTLEVTAPGDLNDYVAKTHAEQNFKVGDTVTFKISVTNIYAVKATVTLKEEAGMTFENGLTTLEDVLDPGQTKTYTATHTLTDADFKNGGVSNTVTVTLKPEGGNPTTGTDTDEVVLEEKPDMSVVKSVVDPKESYRVGDTIQYQIIVTNTGNVTLHDLRLTDVMNADGKVTFPAGTALTRDALAVGETWTVRCSYVVREADEGKVISNKATVIAHDPETKDPEKEAGDTTDGEQVQNLYSLTIHYRNGAGTAVAPSFRGRYHAGDQWKVASPIVAGYYEPYIRSISSDGMPAKDLVYVVTYAAIPAPVDPDPERPNPNPSEPDEEDDETVPTTMPETELPPEPADFTVDPDDYTLTEVEDNETPLANMDLDGHTCCIMHLLLMLAAMVVLGFYTKSRKKHQARIFELKRILAAEEDHPDDPQQP